jgi:hypothetical protein
VVVSLKVPVPELRQTKEGLWEVVAETGMYVPDAQIVAVAGPAFAVGGTVIGTEMVVSCVHVSFEIAVNTTL